MLHDVMPMSFPVLSITAGSVVRRSVGSVVLNAPRTPSWALSSRCACVTTATTRSKRKSEFFSCFFSYVSIHQMIFLILVYLCVAVGLLWQRFMKGNTTSLTWTWTRAEDWWSPLGVIESLRSWSLFFDYK